MIKAQLVILFIAVSISNIPSRHAFAQSPTDHTWERKEMNSTADLAGEYKRQHFVVKSLPIFLDNLDKNPTKDPPSDCVENKTCFRLFYFLGDDFSLSSNRKNILFIAGGPGQVVVTQRPLAFLEADHNVVYFDLRGTGLSVIPGASSFDRFLRADYVVEDLERLRVEVLKGERWDAIYGLSYGTVVAQRYANEHPNSVKRLILEAPIVRNTDFADQRTEMALDNLERVYRLIRSLPTEPCDCKKRDLQVTPIDDLTREPADNMCFLAAPNVSPESVKVLDSRIRRIRTRLVEIYSKLEREYGVIGYVTENYEENLKNNARYQNLFGYPKEFLLALSVLQNKGAPEKNAFVRLGQIEGWDDVALILGYYALSEDGCPISKDCMKDNPFLKFVTNQNCQEKNTYPKRLVEAKKRMLSNAHVTESQRALYVFGLNDGLHPWFYELVNKEATEVQARDCLNPDGLAQFKQNTAHNEKNELLRKIANKIGFADTGNPPCLWNPGNFQHSVQSLVLSGGADAVTAGCQAEVFFNAGLANGSRALIKLPGMGHGIDIPFREEPPSSSNHGVSLGESHLEGHRTDIINTIITAFLEESSINNYKAKIDTPLRELRLDPGGITTGSCAR